MNTTPIKLFSGTAHSEFAKSVAKHMSLQLGDLEVKRFADGETYAFFNESVRGKDCYIIQPTCTPVDQNVMELLILQDALRRASAARITAVIPYYGYARQEKKERPREPITAKMIADLIVATGASRIMTMDLHAEAIQGFFNTPVDHLTSLKLITDYFEPLRNQDLVIVSPDEGRVKKVRQVAGWLNKPIAVGYKYHPGFQETTVSHLAGDVKGKTPIIVEDMIATAGSIMQIVDTLLEHGCNPEIYVAATHGLLVGPAVERLSRPEIAKVVITDTIPQPKRNGFDKCVTLSVAPIFAEAIRRAHDNESISSLFE